MENEIGKTIDEIAKEALDAIKNAETVSKLRKEEEERKIQKKMKDDVDERIKQKMRRVKREIEKEEKNKPEEIDKSFMVHWSNPDKKGIRYEGVYDDKFSFRINRGINLFHLYIEDKGLFCDDWHNNSHTSINLYTLKEKADKLLKESIKKSKNK